MAALVLDLMAADMADQLLDWADDGPEEDPGGDGVRSGAKALKAGINPGSSTRHKFPASRLRLVASRPFPKAGKDLVPGYALQICLDFFEADATAFGVEVVFVDLAVFDVNHAMGVLGDVVLVSHEHDGIALGVETVE